MKTPLFSLGKIVATPGAIAAMAENETNVRIEIIDRHSLGYWGELSESDKVLNNNAIVEGGRILSAYTLKDGETKVWVITEAVGEGGQRECTTVLLPEEY